MRPAQVAAKDRKYQQLLGFLRIFGAGTRGMGQRNVWQRNAG
jgi:hypothetical protein